MRLSLLLSLFASGVLSAASLTVSVDFSSGFDRGDWDEFYDVPGFPQVPVKTVKVLLPYEADLDSVTFRTQVATARKERMSWEISPQPKPLCHDVKWVPEPVSYDEGVHFPEDHVGVPSVVIKHGYRIAYIPVFPVLYHAEKREGFKVRNGELTLKLRKARRAETFRASMQDEKEALALSDDAEAITTYPKPRASRAAAEYLVIGPKIYLSDTHSDSIFRLLFEKNSRGVTTKYLPIEDVLAQTGATPQEKIRNAVKKSYLEEGTRYLLLVGNGYSIAPTKVLTVGSGSLPSDLYFGCLDGNFVSSSDMACEVAVGRAPVSDVEQLHTFVHKSIQLQELSVGDPLVWKVLNFGEKMDGATYASGSLKMLQEGGTAGNGTVTKGYPTSAQFQLMYETSTKLYTPDEVKLQLSTEPFYTVNHLGHCKSTYCMRLEKVEVPWAQATFPFFGMTQGCFPGNLREDNWAATMVLQPQAGAGALIANSNYGWYQPGGADGISNRLHTTFYDTVFNEGSRAIGKTLYRAKERLISQALSNSYVRWVIYETNLFGDPEVNLKFPALSSHR